MDDRGPRRARARSPRCTHDLGQPARIVGEPGQDRRDADADVDSRFGQAAHGFEPAVRWRRAGLRRPPYVFVERRNREEDLHAHTCCRLLQYVEVPDDERPAGHDRERRPGARELVEACAREPEPALRRLVRVGRGAESDLVARPGRARELAAQNVCDVRLHPDRAPVAVVRGAVGALLEVPDVTERAAVHAAHVRVERPLERHPANLRERRLARLEAVLDAHRPRIEHMFDRGKGGNSRRPPTHRRACARSPAMASRRPESGSAQAGAGAGASVASIPASAAAKLASSGKSRPGSSPSSTRRLRSANATSIDGDPRTAAPQSTSTTPRLVKQRFLL